MKTTRRNFLRLGGIAAGAAAFRIAPEGMLGCRAPSGRIALGIVGLGGMGLSHLDAFLAMEDVEVAAVCDVCASKILEANARVKASRGRTCVSFSDYRSLCACPGLDAVVVATPDHSHAAVGIEAACNGKDIYGETPFSHTLEDGRALADAVAAGGRLWFSGNGLLSQPAFRQTAAWVRNGGLGSVARAEIGLPGGGRGPVSSGAPLAPPAGLNWAAWLGDAPACDYRGICDFHWRWVSAWGGGSLMDGIGRYGDVALWGLGRESDGPVRIEGTGEFPSDGVYDTATAFSFRCFFRDGLELAVSDGGRMASGVGVRWIGRNGEWVWISRGACETSSPELKREIFGADGVPSFEGSEHRRAFVACVRTRKASASTSAEVAHRAATLGHLGLLAMRAGQPLGFDPRTEAFSRASVRA